MHKKLFVYELKNLFPVTLIIILLSIFYMLLSTNVNIIDLLGPIIVISLFVLSIKQYKFVMGRKSTDLFYSLPIKRRTLYITKLLAAMVMITGIIFLVTFSSFLIISRPIYYPFHPVIYYLVLWLSTLGILCYMSFVFSRAHSTFDGFMFILMHIVFLPMILLTISIFSGQPLGLFGLADIAFFNLFGSINFLTSQLALLGGTMYSVLPEVTTRVLILSFNPLLGYLSIVYVWFFEKNHRLEDVKDLSNSWIGYKTFLPIFILFLAASMMALMRYYSIPLIVIMSYVGYVIYQRTAKISLNVLVIMFLEIVISISLVSIFV